MECPKCHYQNDDQFDYCQQCGEYLHEENQADMKEEQSRVQTIKVLDKKKLLKWVFTSVLFTGVIIGGYSLFQVHNIQIEANKKVEELEKENKKQKKQIEKMNSQMDKSSVDYEKEILELEKKNNDLEKQITELEKEVEELSKGSSKKDDSSQSESNESSNDTE